MVLMSGLPGAGKDTWVEANLPGWARVSLDELRAELGVAPDGDQGQVRQLGVERMREHLRAGRPFVHLATNLDRQRRGPLLALAADYGFSARIVYCELPRAELFARNHRRQGVARVPERVIERMTDRWEVPMLTEAHRVELVVEG
jgi:predicted kinase